MCTPHRSQYIHSVVNMAFAHAMSPISSGRRGALAVSLNLHRSAVRRVRYDCVDSLSVANDSVPIRLSLYKSPRTGFRANNCHSGCCPLCYGANFDPTRAIVFECTQTLSLFTETHRRTWDKCALDIIYSYFRLFASQASLL